jgi:predicted DNA-binding transcriptional regulator YafY
MQLEDFEKLERLDFLIRKKATGTPSELSKKMGVSERAIYKYLKFLKSLGAEVKYSKQRQSYYYLYEGYFQFRFYRTDLSKVCE